MRNRHRLSNTQYLKALDVLAGLLELPGTPDHVTAQFMFANGLFSLPEHTKAKLSKAARKRSTEGVAMARRLEREELDRQLQVQEPPKRLVRFRLVE